MINSVSHVDIRDSENEEKYQTLIIRFITFFCNADV